MLLISVGALFAVMAVASRMTEDTARRSRTIAFWLLAIVIMTAIALAMTASGYAALAAGAIIILVGMPLLFMGFGLAFGASARLAMLDGKTKRARTLQAIPTIAALALLAYGLFAAWASKRHTARFLAERGSAEYAVVIPTMPPPSSVPSDPDFEQAQRFYETVNAPPYIVDAVAVIPGAPSIVINPMCWPRGDDSGTCLSAVKDDPRPDIGSQRQSITTFRAITLVPWEDDCAFTVASGPNTPCAAKDAMEAWCAKDTERLASAVCEDPEGSRLRFTLNTLQVKPISPSDNVPQPLPSAYQDMRGQSPVLACSLTRDSMRATRPGMGRLCFVRWWAEPWVQAEVMLDGTEPLQAAALRELDRGIRVWDAFTRE